MAVKRIGLRRESLVAENRVHLQVAREVAILSQVSFSNQFVRPPLFRLSFSFSQITQVKHPHVIELYDSFFTKSAGFLVLEILGDFDLMEFVRQVFYCRLFVLLSFISFFVSFPISELTFFFFFFKGLGENNVRILFSQLLSALNYCHLLGVLFPSSSPFLASFPNLPLRLSTEM